MKRHLPNIITLVNLFCGLLAIVSLLYGQFTQAVILIFIGGLADFMDGLVARLLKVNSPMGKELDSLADMVTFGVVPGMIVFILLNKGASIPSWTEFPWGATPAFLITLFSALRLAKFNLDTRQTENFIGLATPAATIFVVGLLLIYINDSFGWSSWVLHPIILYTIIICLSLLLVSEIRMFSLKFKSLKWEGNQKRYIFAIISIGLIAFFREASLSMIIFFYIIMNLIMGKYPSPSKL